MLLNLPNILTLSNLFCGCCALLYVLHGQVEMAAYFTLASFVFDYADGMVARALRISSPLGKELDSLADVISFGVVPGALLYQILAQQNDTNEGVVLLALPVFILSAFAGLRLGKFNLDTRQVGFFLGLSTPACTVFILGLALTADNNRFGFGVWLAQNTWLIWGLIPLLCWLMISEIPMFGLKIKRFDLKSNIIPLGFVGAFGAAYYWLGTLSLSLVIVCYIFASIVFKHKVIES